MAIPRWLDMLGRVFRACPRVRGKGRLARWVLAGYLDHPEIELRSKSGDVFLIPYLGDPIGVELLIHGDWEWNTSRFVLDHLPRGGTFIDVGANVGVFSVPAARQVGTAGRVLSIEASPRIFGYLQHNLIRNGIGNAVACACAAHDHDEEAISFWEAPADHFGMGALAPQFSGNPTRVAARTLDRLLADAGIERADVLKVDVEGFEAPVFRGARQLLTSPRAPLVVFEFCDWAEARSGQAVGSAQRVLQENGYRLSRLTARGGEEPLNGVLSSGFEMLIARKPS
jgi:FkbM family methyltransferase